MIRVVVVDDERIARDGLCRLLEEEEGIDVVGNSSNGRDAVAKIRALAPDLVFLDIQLPELDGFGVLGALSEAERPCIVFVTAHDRYAVDAFNVNAVDYLLKPFDRPRLQSCLGRARRHVESLSPSPQVLIKDRGESALVSIDDVIWVESEGNYLHVGTRGRVFLMRETLRAFEVQLDTRRFLRVSRSTLVRRDMVSAVRPLGDGRYRISLRSGHHFESSRRFRLRVRTLLANTLDHSLVIPRD